MGTDTGTNPACLNEWEMNKRKRYLDALHHKRSLEQFLQSLPDYGQSDLMERNGVERVSLCIVCSEPAASYMTGPHGVISKRTERGGRISQLVAVHERCVEQAAALAEEHGCEWDFPAPPSWRVRPDPER